MVICMLTVKMIVDMERPRFYKFLRGENLKQQ